MSKYNIGSRLKAWARGVLSDGDEPAQVVTHRPPKLPAGVVPTETKLAMDDALVNVYQYANSVCGYGSFLGYPALAMLTQQAEYRMLSEKTAQAMVRKWIKLKSTSDSDKSERIAKIDAELKRLRVRELFGEVAKFDGFFGRCQLFIDLGEQGTTQEGAQELQLPLIMDKSKLKGRLRKFKLVEPMYTYPNDYSASNPMADDYYAPRSWFVMGLKVHSDRLLTFVGRPVPDILKPTYNFGGISMSQLAKPYVDNWIKTRSSVNKLISNFSTSGIKTNMQGLLSGGNGEDELSRAQLYSDMRDNQGTMMLDMETEDFFQFNVPLTTIDALQAQAQEHMASVSSMPLSILLGITPTGLNASTDGEIRTFYDHVLDMQEVLFAANLSRVIDLIQLSLFGDVDTDIGFEFVPLWQQSEQEMAQNRKMDAETAAIYAEMGAVSAEVVRNKLAADENSQYNGLDIAAEGHDE